MSTIPNCNTVSQVQKALVFNYYKFVDEEVLAYCSWLLGFVVTMETVESSRLAGKLSWSYYPDKQVLIYSGSEVLLIEKPDLTVDKSYGIGESKSVEYCVKYKRFYEEVV